jgi:hypothetical protein
MGTTTTTFALNKPTVGGDDNAWGADLNSNADKLDDLLDGTTAIKPNLSEGLWKVGGTAVTVTAAELNILDGVTATAAEINVLDGVTSTAAELNILDGVTATTAELNYLDITTLGTSQASKAVTADSSGNVKFANAVTETVFAVSGTTPALSPTNGTIQTWTLSANSTPTAGTWPEGQSMTLMIDDGTARTITWTSMPVTWKTGAGAAPALIVTGFTPIALWKVGTVIYGARIGDA